MEKSEKIRDDYEILKQEVSRIDSERARLQTEKEILLYNISVLFQTAREEIKRKDSTIAELRKSLEKYERPPCQ
ncbi:hypothetical protein GpartN1_g3074.t1 [Galdieria partita]|uniref:Uncharacterized protein n=1 Tax=Galdieria partita TaxID=83374 RepID=A0A9C7PUU5_9RHOD|nr:hypothetical protein GpartN1_g3074.t1 [Galdieria partita]